MANMAIGKLAETMHWTEGSPEKIALHAAAAAVLAELAGGNAGAAAAGAGAEELANGILQKMLAADPSLSKDQKVAIGEWAAAFVGAASGGTQGAAASLDNFNYNYLYDKQALDLRHAEDACDGGRGDHAACLVAGSLKVIDSASDENVIAACHAGPTDPTCAAELDLLRSALASLVAGRDGLSDYDEHFLEDYLNTEMALLSDPDGSKGFLASFLLGGVGTAVEGTAAKGGAAAASEGSHSYFLPSPPAGTQSAWTGTIMSGEVPQGGMIAYRIWGGTSERVGSWLSPVIPESYEVAKNLLALPSGNTAEMISEVFIPSGTHIQYGTAAPAFGQPGGGIQIQLLDRIPTSSFGPGSPY